MIRQFMFVCIVCLSVAVSSSAQECSTMKIGGVNNWLPVAYADPDSNKPKGVAYDVARLVGEQLQIPVDITTDLPWLRVLEYAKKGTLDMIAGIYWTEERDALYQFLVPYFQSEVRVFVVKGKEFSFNSFEDLIGRTGGIPRGGSFGQEFDDFAQKHQLALEEVNTSEQLIGKLLGGRNDYFLKDYLDGMLYLKENDLQEKIVALPNPVSSTDVFLAVSRQSPCLSLVPQMNEILENAQKDGTIQEIIDGYITAKAGE